MKTLSAEERLQKLEDAVFGIHVDTNREHGDWKQRHNDICWERNSMTDGNDEWALVRIEKPCGYNGNKPRVSAQMNRGITLYAKYIPAYKDIIKKMEQVQTMLEGGKVQVTDVINLPDINI